MTTRDKHWELEYNKLYERLNKASRLLTAIDDTLSCDDPESICGECDNCLISKDIADWKADKNP